MFDEVVALGASSSLFRFLQLREEEAVQAEEGGRRVHLPPQEPSLLEAEADRVARNGDRSNQSRASAAEVGKDGCPHQPEFPSRPAKRDLRLTSPSASSGRPCRSSLGGRTFLRSTHSSGRRRHRESRTHSWAHPARCKWDLSRTRKTMKSTMKTNCRSSCPMHSGGWAKGGPSWRSAPLASLARCSRRRSQAPQGRCLLQRWQASRRVVERRRLAARSWRAPRSTHSARRTRRHGTSRSPIGDAHARPGADLRPPRAE